MFENTEGNEILSIHISRIPPDIMVTTKKIPSKKVWKKTIKFNAKSVPGNNPRKKNLSLQDPFGKKVRGNQNPGFFSRDLTKFGLFPGFLIPGFYFQELIFP